MGLHQGSHEMVEWNRRIIKSLDWYSLHRWLPVTEKRYFTGTPVWRRQWRHQIKCIELYEGSLS